MHDSAIGRRRGLRLLVLALACTCATTAAFAQSRQRFDIPAQAAADSLRLLARESGVQIFSPSEDVSGIRTNPVRGEFTPQEALQALLKDTGLEIVPSGDATYTVRKAGAAPPPARASNADTPSNTLEVITVTGSRIKRAGFDTLQSAMVDDAEQIERRGYTNIAQALEASPLFSASDSSPQGNLSGNGIAQTFVNLFGLGSQRTLTLVDGRRYVSSNSAAATAAPGGSQVDLNLIPAGLVDHVETVAIGGAPVYGSDAIAGTVNIILKDNVEGFQGSVQTGISDRDQAASNTVRMLFGHNFADGRGNFVLAAEHNEQDGLLYSQRFSNLYQLLSNPADSGPGDGISSLRVIDHFTYPFLTEGGLPYNGSLANVPGFHDPDLYPNGNYIFDSAGRPLRFAPDGNLVPFNPGNIVQSSAGILPVYASGGDGMDPGKHVSLLAPTTRTLVNANGHFDITPSLRAFVETSFAHSKGERLSDLSAFSAPGIFGGPTLTFSVDNPFLSTQAHDTLVANGLSEFNLARNLNDLVDRGSEYTELDVYRIVTGLEGKFDLFDDEWSWNLSYNYGRSRNFSHTNEINPDRLLAAVDAVRDAGGNIVCASAAPGCVPIDLFGENAFSQAAANYVTDPASSVSINTQKILTANMAGKLPFGIAAPIAVNIGAERREEAASFRPDAVMQAGDTLIGDGVGAYQGVAGQFTTKEIYGELSAPLVIPDQGFPLIKSATFESAVRYVDNSVAGSATTWSAGGRLAPQLPGWGDGLTFRGVYTRSIRAPSINELFLGTTPVTSSISDPCDADNYNRGANPSVRAANCAAALAAVGAGTPDQFSATTNGRSASGFQSGNPNLKNETADSWSVGFVYQPKEHPRFRAAMDWSSISIKGGIESLGIASILQSCYDSPGYPSAACSNFHRLTAADIAAGNGTGGAARTPGDIASGYLTGYFNTATIKFAGLAASAEYDVDLHDLVSSWQDAGSLRFGAKLLYTDKYDFQPFANQPAVHDAGTVALPRYKVQANLGYTWHRFSTDWQALWRSASSYDKTLTYEDTPVNQVPSYTLINATFGYEITDNVRAQFIVSNVFDKQEPYAALANSSLSSFDVLGRSYFLSLFVSF